MRQIDANASSVSSKQTFENTHPQNKGWEIFIYFTIFGTMDFQFWLYVIIAVIYVLSRALKKKETPDATERQPAKPVRPGHSNIPTTEKPRQLTFEELLKEITEAKQPPVVPRPVPTFSVPSQREVVDYDDDLEDEEQDLETIQEDRIETNEYEQSRRQAFARASLEETMNVRDTDMRFGKFKEFETEKQNNLLEEYTKDLQSPEGLKKAFVLTEIFNRKF
jgi:hypothetical protein